MSKTIRSRNLDLIRCLNQGHKNTAQRLSHITNSNYVSKMASGEMNISTDRARLIEEAVKLPEGWLDRDNAAILEMTPIEAEIHLLVAKLPKEKQFALLKLLTPDNC